MRKTAICMLVLFFLVAAQIFVYSQRQPRIQSGNGRGEDGVFYGAMAEQMLAGNPIRGDAPFVYRIGTPWLASVVVRLFGVSVDGAFVAVNTCGLLVFLVLIYMSALRICAPEYALLSVALYSLPWWSFTRSLFFCPVLVDIPWLVIMYVGLIILTSEHTASGTRRRIDWFLFPVLCFLAPLFRETGVILGITYLLSRYWVRRYVSWEVFLGRTLSPERCESPTSRRNEVLYLILLLALTVLGGLLPRLLVEPTGIYTFSQAIQFSVMRNTLWHLVSSILLAFGGPLLALFLIAPAHSERLSSQYPAAVIFVLTVIVAAYLGGVNTIRFLSWASPVVLAFECYLLQNLLRECRGLPHAPKWFLRAWSMGAAAFYIVMIHPFSGYYTDYTAWIEWGGMRFSSIRALRYALPCILIAVTYVMIARFCLPSSPPADATLAPKSPPK